MAQKKSKVWEYFNKATYSKQKDCLDDPNFDRDYLPFLINRGLSYHPDTIRIMALLNQNAILEPKLQFLVLLNTVRARKRWASWLSKPKVTEDVLLLAEYYECSTRRAMEMVRLHTPKQLKFIRQKLEKGGIIRGKAPA